MKAGGPLLRLVEPSAEDQRRGLVDVAEAIASQVVELHIHPSVEAAEYVAANLDGARRTVLRFREALLREGTGDGQCAW